MMKRKTPDIRDDMALKAWFADAGLSVEIVDSCPEAACEFCSAAFDRAA